MSGPLAEYMEEPESFWANDSLQRVLDFVRRFGRQHMTLAMHAALPLGLTPELVHLLRLNFREPARQLAPPIAEADLLLSPLCREVGGEKYEMPRGVRELLLHQLRTDPAFGMRRVRRVAEFLYVYTSARLGEVEDEETLEFLEAQQWAAIAYLSPKSAAEGMASALGEGLAADEPDKALRVAHLVKSLSTPLFTQGKFVLYARAVEEVASGADPKRAEAYVTALGPSRKGVMVGRTALPSPEGLLRMLRPELASILGADARDEDGDEGEAERPPRGFSLRHMLRGHSDSVTYVAWHPNAQMIVSTSLDGSVRVWDLGTLAFGRERVERVARWITAASITPDFQAIFVSFADGTLRALRFERLFQVSRANDDKTLLIDKNHADYITSVVVTPDSRKVITGSDDATLFVRDVETPKRTRRLRGHDAGVNALAATPDGRSVVSASWDGTLRVWDLESGALLNVLQGHTGGVNAVALMPDGRHVVSGGDDATIRVWSLDGGMLLNVIEGHRSYVTALCVSHDGRLLASRSADDTVRLWRCDTWAQLAVLRELAPDNSAPATLAFCPSSSAALVTLDDSDRTLRVWDLDLDTLFGVEPAREEILYTTAKIALIGDSGVGKTGLGWRLAHGEFKETPSTHGQQFWVIDELGLNRADGTRCEAVLWDLAGQPDYRLVHTLFFDEVDLALVLFDPTNRYEPLRDVEFWLRQLARERSDGRRRHLILVGARADRGTPTLTQKELEEFCLRNNIDGGFVMTSAYRNDGVGELIERIKTTIAWDEFPATVTTGTFKRVRELVLKVKEDTGRSNVLLGSEELRSLLEAADADWQFTDVEMLTAVRQLSTHGFVSMLRGSTGEDKILLVPELLNNLASSIVLEARRNEKGLGALEERVLLEGRYGFDAPKGIDKYERDVLLDAAVVLFIEHNLCFREALGTQTLLIFPALINQKRPQLEEAETVDDYSYRVTGAVENVYAALVVQLGYTNTFTRTNQWQNQAEYETARGDLCGFRQVVEREGEVELVLYYTEQTSPTARILFRGLVESFLTRLNISVLKIPPVTCPKCEYKQSPDTVTKRISEGKEYIFCPNCGERVPLPPPEKAQVPGDDSKRLEVERELVSRRTAFESAMVRLKGHVRDERKEAPRCFVSYAWGDATHESWVRMLAGDLQNAGLEVIIDHRESIQIGASLARFISRIEEVDFVLTVGTPLYLEKFRGQFSSTGSVVAAEVNMINLRCVESEEASSTVLPLLLEGREATSFPPLLRGRVYADFRDETVYFVTLFDLILTLYGIPFETPAIADLRESLRASVGRLR